MALREDNRDYAQSIAVLSMTNLAGARDPAFVATHGGLLMLDGQSDAAEEVWRAARKRGFSPVDQKRIFFRPKTKGAATQWTGAVASISPGFAFISVPKFGDVFCAGNRIGARILRKGDPITFEVAFTVLGATVANIMS